MGPRIGLTLFIAHLGFRQTCHHDLSGTGVIVFGLINLFNFSDDSEILFWDDNVGLEINERPLKRPLVDFGNLSVSDNVTQKGMLGSSEHHFNH